MSSDANAPDRTIGLFGAVITLVGFVVGASIYILPGAIAASAGPGVVISYGIACLLALFSCIVAAQIGVAYPASGASFVIIGRLVSPFIGFLLVWMMIGAAAVAIALLGYGFADYIGVWISGGHRSLIGGGVIILFTIVNLLGARETLSAQSAMVFAFTIALLLFSGAGLLNAAPENFAPFLPNGVAPALAGAVPAFFSFAGFLLIIELGGEIKNPGRTIPLSLALSFLTVFLIYALVSLALVGVIPWTELSTIDAPIAEAAARILPGPVANFISLTALAATVSSINAMLMGYSRDVFVLARGGVLPEIMATTIGRHGTPIGGVLTISALGLGAFLCGAKITDYATFVVVGLLLLQIGLGAAAIVLARSDNYQRLKNTFRMPPLVFGLFSLGLIVLSLAFMALVMRGAMATAVAAGVYLAFGIAYYVWRKQNLKGGDRPLEQRLNDVLG